MGGEDGEDLRRFVEAQAAVWPAVLRELGAGRKTSHWMWFVFPQLRGLGRSGTARRFALSGLSEARAYLAHPLLGPRLLKATRLVLAIEDRSALAIFGSPDALKLRSSMTLFEAADPRESAYPAVLDRLYGGARDPLTLDLLAAGGGGEGGA
jgi:uncharacterized protein (DUF1810 family)